RARARGAGRREADQPDAVGSLRARPARGADRQGVQGVRSLRIVAPKAPIAGTGRRTGRSGPRSSSAQTTTSRKGSPKKAIPATIRMVQSGRPSQDSSTPRARTSPTAASTYPRATRTTRRFLRSSTSKLIPDSGCEVDVREGARRGPPGAPPAGPEGVHTFRREPASARAAGLPGPGTDRPAVAPVLEGARPGAPRIPGVAPLGPGQGPARRR